MTTEYLDIAVAGLHLSGEPLNHQLLTLGATLKKTCLTSATYKMYLVSDEKGKKPGLVRLPKGEKGNQYELEIWAVPMENVGKFIAQIPQPLGIGTLDLEDSSQVKGFICEPLVASQCEDISQFSGWRAYLKSLTVF
jgi:allophanate hydrolase